MRLSRAVSARGGRERRLEVPGRSRLDVLQLQAQCGQRRAQLVRGVGHERLLGRQHLGEPRGGVVEDRGELAELRCAAVRRGAGREVARRHPAGRPDEPVDRTGDAPCEHESEDGDEDQDPERQRDEPFPHGPHPGVERRARVGDPHRPVHDPARRHGHGDVDEVGAERVGVAAPLGPAAVMAVTISGRFVKSTPTSPGVAESATLTPSRSTMTIRPPGSRGTTPARRPRPDGRPAPACPRTGWRRRGRRARCRGGDDRVPGGERAAQRVDEHGEGEERDREVAAEQACPHAAASSR